MNGALPCRLLLMAFLLRTLCLSGQGTGIHYHLTCIEGDSLSDYGVFHPVGNTGQRLGAPFYANVVDNEGDPVAGFPVRFVILSEPEASSGAFFEKETVYTDSAGEAGATLAPGRKGG